MSTESKKNDIKESQEDVTETVDTSDKVQKQKEEIKEKTVEEKLKEAEEKLLRSLAEIENQRRRFEKEIKEAFEFGSYNFAKESLSSLDNLQRAKEAIRNDEKLKNNKDLDRFIENITIVEKDLISIFEKNNIKKVDVKNQKFNPNFHQAMSEIEDDKTEPGTIIKELQAGYMLADRLLRPSLVSVSKRKSPKDEGNKDKNEKK